jgi:hypothetical protein
LVSFHLESYLNGLSIFVYSSPLDVVLNLCVTLLISTFFILSALVRTSADLKNLISVALILFMSVALTVTSRFRITMLDLL